MMRYGLEKKRKKHQKNKVRSSFSLSDSGMTGRAMGGERKDIPRYF
jgi:hypothetical protein